MAKTGWHWPPGTDLWPTDSSKNGKKRLAAALRKLILFSQHQTGKARLSPWNRQPPALIYMTKTSKSMLQKVQLYKAQRTIGESGHGDLQFYTDGSTTAGTINGGAGMIIARFKEVLHRWHASTGVRSSAYSAKKAALEVALKWIESENDWHEMNWQNRKPSGDPLYRILTSSSCTERL